MSLELAREEVLVRSGELHLLYVEKRNYLQALAEARAGLEKARVILSEARMRVAGREE